MLRVLETFSAINLLVRAATIPLRDVVSTETEFSSRKVEYSTNQQNMSCRVLYITNITNEQPQCFGLYLSFSMGQLAKGTPKDP